MGDEESRITLRHPSFFLSFGLKGWRGVDYFRANESLAWMLVVDLDWIGAVAVALSGADYLYAGRRLAVRDGRRRRGLDAHHGQQPIGSRQGRVRQEGLCAGAKSGQAHCRSLAVL